MFQAYSKVKVVGSLQLKDVLSDKFQSPLDLGYLESCLTTMSIFFNGQIYQLHLDSFASKSSMRLTTTIAQRWRLCTFHSIGTSYFCAPGPKVQRTVSIRNRDLHRRCPKDNQRFCRSRSYGSNQHWLRDATTNSWKSSVLIKTISKRKLS